MPWTTSLGEHSENGGRFEWSSLFESALATPLNRNRTTPITLGVGGVMQND